jgi:hypothetical protein
MQFPAKLSHKKSPMKIGFSAFSILFDSSQNCLQAIQNIPNNEMLNKDADIILFYCILLWSTLFKAAHL